MIETRMKQRARTAMTVVLMALVAGFGGGVLSQVGHMGRMGQRTTVTSGSRVTQPKNPMVGTGVTWHGLSPLNAVWMRQFLSGKIETAKGQTVDMPTTTPMLLTAYWCPYCHETLQLLNSTHLLHKVHVVALGFDESDGGQPAAIVTNVKEAALLYQKAMRQIGVPLLPNQILYAMPGTPADKEVMTYPTLLVPHQGHWYYLNGYVDNPSLYKSALS